MRLVRAAAITILTLASVSQASELIRRVAIDQVNAGQTEKIDSAFYEKFMNYDMNSTQATCALRLYNKVNGEASSIGFAYLVDESTETPKGWFAVKVVDGNGRTGKIQSYVQPTTKGTTQIDSVCWE